MGLRRRRLRSGRCRFFLALSVSPSLDGRRRRRRKEKVLLLPERTQPESTHTRTDTHRKAAPTNQPTSTPPFTPICKERTHAFDWRRKTRREAEQHLSFHTRKPLSTRAHSPFASHPTRIPRPQGPCGPLLRVAQLFWGLKRAGGGRERVRTWHPSSRLFRRAVS